MKDLLLIFVSIFWLPVNALTQVECLSNGDGVFNNDEPPGCISCIQTLSISTASKTAENFIFDFPCGEIENSQWFTLKPGVNGSIRVLFDVKNCQTGNGVEAGIYDRNFNLVSQCRIITSTDEVVALNLVEDDPYYLLIDGIDGSICELTLLTANHLGQEEVIINQFSTDVQGPFCIGTELCLSIPGNGFVSQYEWSTSSFPIINGGGQQDTFICLDLNSDILGSVFINPFSPCIAGRPTIIQFSVEDEISHPLDTTICEGTCVQIGDSCYANAGFYEVFIETPADQCDTNLFISINHAEILPSPLVKCEEQSGQLFLKWNIPSGATQFEVFINRDSITTVSDNFILLDDLPEGVPIDVKIQPKGNCTYLPGETSCTIGTSNSKNNFLDNKIAIFPNPTNGEINIKTDLKIELVEVFDLAGRILQKEKTTSFELKNRAPGVYFFKIKTSEGVGVKRIIKK